ncbi:hypothetical protein TWF281_004485 [Arthrobotrys megalospora]
MWFSFAAWLFLARLGVSNAYFIAVSLKPVDTDLLNLSPEDSIEYFFDGIDRPSTSILEGTTRLLPALEAATENSDSPLSGLGIAGRISIPSRNLQHPRAGYHGAATRRISDILGEAAGIPLVRTASGRSQASSQQHTEDGIRVATNSVPPNSRGRCSEFIAPEGDFILQSIKLFEFAEEDEVPSGISIFSAPGCRKNHGFVRHREIDRTSMNDEYEINLTYLNQPLVGEFSILPVYGDSDDETPLYKSSHEDINQNIGLRPDAPSPLLERLQDIDLDDNLLEDTVDDYLRQFDVPWARLMNTRRAQGQPDDEEEKTEATRPATAGNNRPRLHYINPAVASFEGFDIPSGSPRALNIRYADSDEDLDPANIAPGGGNAGVNNAEQEGITQDIANYDLSESQYINPEDIVQIGSEVFVRGYPDALVQQINPHPDTAALDPWQYRENMKGPNPPSSEDKGL